MAALAAFRASVLKSDPSVLFLVTCVSTSAIFRPVILSRSISITGIPDSSTIDLRGRHPLPNIQNIEPVRTKARGVFP